MSLGSNEVRYKNLETEFDNGKPTKCAKPLLNGKMMTFTSSITTKVSYKDLMENPDILKDSFDQEWMRREYLMEHGYRNEDIGELPHLHIFLGKLEIHGTNNNLPSDLIVQSDIIKNPTGVKYGDEVIFGIPLMSGPSTITRIYNPDELEKLENSKKYKTTFDMLSSYTDKTLIEGGTLIEKKNGHYDKDVYLYKKGGHVMKLMNEFQDELNLKDKKLLSEVSPDGMHIVAKKLVEFADQKFKTIKSVMPISEKASYTIRKLGCDWNDLYDIKNSSTSEDDLKKIITSKQQITIDYTITFMLIEPK